MLSLPNLNGIEIADFTTDSTANTFFFVDDIWLAFLSSDRIFCTITRTQAATGTLIRNDIEGNQFLADPSRAAFIADMGFVFLAKIADGSENWIRSRLPQAAQRSSFNRLAETFKLLDIPFLYSLSWWMDGIS